MESSYFGERDFLGLNIVGKILKTSRRYQGPIFRGGGVVKVQEVLTFGDFSRHSQKNFILLKEL